LTVDEDGIALHPNELGRRLETLGRITGSELGDAIFPFLIVYDVDEMLDHWWRRRAFLARYAKQSMLQWDDVESTDVRRYCEAVAVLLKEENAASITGEDG